MKIIFVLPDMPGGGTERVVALLSNEFVKRGYQVAILLFAGNQVAYPLDEHIEIHISGQASGGDIQLRLKRLKDMRNYYKKNAGCYIFAFSVMGAVFSVLAAVGIQHHLLISERNDPSKYEHQEIRDWAYAKADRVVFQTEEMKSCFEEKIRKKSVVIQNPVADNIPDPYEGNRKKRIVSVGRLEKQKNHKLLIDAFAKFVEQYPDYELHIFGVGKLEDELKENARQLGVDKYVFFRGFSENVKEEIRDSAMFVLSSDYEGISNSMIEALAMGVPVISTDCPIGGSRSYIEDNISGLLVPVGDKEALVAAMEKIAGNTKLASYLSENSVKIKQKYSLSSIADEFLKEAGIQ